MEYVDVIGIGAINYDYMFPCKNIKNTNINPDDGRERIGRPNSDVEEEIMELHKTCKNNYSTQIGGSALLALKAVHAIDNSLSIGFIGVCGQTEKFDEVYGKSLKPKNELSFIDNQEWLFYTNENTPIEKRHIGRACVKLNKENTRGNINISNGANDLICDLISKKEKEENLSLIDFLIQAKWIHISSLANFEYFKNIMEYVIKAKERNRFLKISIDPGNQYTEDYREELQKYLKFADYVFLNKDECNNLILNEDLPINEKYIKLSSFFNKSNNKSCKVFIVKYKNRHELIDFINNVPYVHYHTILPFYKIYNDTGAGDCFAGGFIAGMLSDRLIAQQPAPIELGVLASKTRMTTIDNNEVYSNIENNASKYFLKKYKNGFNNKKQNFAIYIKEYYKAILGFISGVMISIIATIIYSLIFK